VEPTPLELNRYREGIINALSDRPTNSVRRDYVVDKTRLRSLNAKPRPRGDV
jgi:hypothetical protein